VGTRGNYVLPTSFELDRFGEGDADIMLYGHTHRQVVRRVDQVLVVNPGSAGEGRDPRNGGQLRRAVLDTVTEEVVVRDSRLWPPVGSPSVDKAKVEDFAAADGRGRHHSSSSDIRSQAGPSGPPHKCP
jgi:hypothetical protein